MPPDHDLDLVRLPELNILPCTGCYRCVDDGVCRIEDDMAFLVEQVAVVRRPHHRVARLFPRAPTGA